MKLAIALLAALSAFAQTQQAVIVIPGAPPGGIGAACTAPALFYGNLSTGVIAGCQSSVWTALGGGGGGDFVGPASATDNAAVRFNGTTGKLGQDSLMIIGDAGEVSTPSTISAGVGGSVAGAIGLGAGTAASIVANTITHYAPGSVTGYNLLEPAAAGTGVKYYINTANVVAESFLSMPNCVDTGGNHLNFTLATPAFSCGTSGGATPASVPWRLFGPLSVLAGHASQNVAGRVNCALVTAPFPGVVVPGIRGYTSVGTGHIALAFYSAAGNLLQGSAEVNAPGGNPSVFAFSPSLTLTAGTVYASCFTSDQLLDAFYASGQYDSATENVGLSSPNLQIFYCTNTATSAAGVTTFPATCGAQTAQAAPWGLPALYSGTQ